jgi:hypothetical protein
MVLQCTVLRAGQPHDHQRELGHRGEGSAGGGRVRVLGMTVPGLELFAQSVGVPVESAGPIWRVIAGELASRAELAEVTR